MMDTIKTTLHFERGSIVKLNRENIYVIPEAVTHIEEPHDLTQGKMVMGYRMNVPYESPLYSSVQVASVILGGGGSSRFFKVIREREGLCYTIYSRLEKYKSIMLVYAGVDFENFERTERLVIEQIEDIRAGNISDDELEIAKKTLISNIQSISDYPNSYINYYYNLLISESVIDVDAFIERINKVTKESIVEALVEMRLDTVARLTKEAKDA
jgi:predicted Zn-dependent peptidase